MDPSFLLTHLWCAYALEQTGQYAEALDELHEANRLSGGSPWTQTSLASTLARSGNTGEARRILDEVVQQSAHRYVSPFFVALVWVALGDHERAFEWLERAYEERSHWMTFLNVEPRLDPLRSDARLEDLRRRVGLPESSSSPATRNARP